MTMMMMTLTSVPTPALDGFTAPAAAELATWTVDDHGDGVRAFRGLAFGVLLSLPVWGAVGAVAYALLAR